MNFKDGDIFNWSWTDSKLKKMDLQQRSGTTYWCKSRFAIFNKDKEVFKDTYWNGQEDFTFHLEDINKDIELEFIANMNELRPCEITEFNYYDNSDCVNISHPNMTRSGRYIKKNAARSLDKMKRVVEAHLEHYKNEARYAAQEVERMEEDLKNLTVESYVTCRQDVYIY